VSAQDSQEEAVQKGQKVAQAGAAAASSSPPEQAQENAAQAMRAERDRVKLEISPKLLDGFQERGAFDAPPEPVQAPQQAQTVAEPDTGEPPATEVPPAVPQKQTFAHRYMGLGG
jgi:hypothetical protein